MQHGLARYLAPFCAHACSQIFCPKWSSCTWIQVSDNATTQELGAAFISALMSTTLFLCKHPGSHTGNFCSTPLSGSSPDEGRRYLPNLDFWLKILLNAYNNSC